MAEDKLKTIDFKSLIKHDRAVKVVSRKSWGRKEGFVYVVVQLAGDQGPRGESKLISIGFKDGVSAKEAAGSLMSVLREGMAQGWIDQNNIYNEVIHRWGQAALKKIDLMNKSLLAAAEQKARTAPPSDVLMDIRGMTLKDYLTAGLRMLGLRPDEEKKK
jgi:hypothetical protein